MNELEIRAYKDGESKMKQHYSDFVRDNPEVSKVYNEWIDKKKKE